jgi:hypothetical protein
VKRLLLLLRDLTKPVIGVLENMVMRPGGYVKSEVESLGLTYMGAIEYDEELEETIGNPDRLMNTRFGKGVGKLIRNLS